MTDEEKGYHCPSDELAEEGKGCYECPFRKTKCIVYSTAGKKKLREHKRALREMETAGNA